MTKMPDEFWDSVGEKLQGDAFEWWNENKVLISDLAKKDIEVLFEALKRGASISAKYHISRTLMREDRPAWVSYQRNTLDQLSDIADRRVKLLKAIESLGMKIAETIGRAALEAIGDLY